MKKIYQTPSFDVVYYNSVNIITASNPKQSSSPSDSGQMWGNRHNAIWDEDE